MWPFDKSYSVSTSGGLKSFEKLKPCITFDDVVLEPQYSDIVSRKDVDTRARFLNKKDLLSTPIIAANMDTVVNTNVSRLMQDYGGMAILHRYQSKEETLFQIQDLISTGHRAIPSIGIQEGEYEKAVEYVKAGAAAICVDIAHGDSKHMVDMVKRLSKTKVNKKKIVVIAGNVATKEGALRLIRAGASIIKTGVGSGAACVSREVAGHGIPQLVALMEVASLKTWYRDFTIIADGGIRKPGDIAKALAFGADLVMVGSLVGSCIESPGELIQGQKVYRGMASKEARVDFDTHIPTDYSAEGVSMMRTVTGTLRQAIDKLMGGLRSGMSYSGAHNLKEYRRKARFMLVSGHGYTEGTPHGLKSG